MRPDNQIDAEAQSASEARPNYQVVSRLIARAADRAAPGELAEILKVDPVLCYALMAEVGAAGPVLAKYVTTCKQAIERLGSAVFSELLNGALEHATKVSAFSEVVRNALIRARFMELMTTTMDSKKDTGEVYLIGLFSKLDALLGIPLPDLILPMPFPEEMRSAILEQAGRTGRLLKFAQTIELADEPGMDFMQTNLHLPSFQVYEAYNEAYDWVGEIESQYVTGD